MNQAKSSISSTFLEERENVARRDRKALTRAKNAEKKMKKGNRLVTIEIDGAIVTTTCPGKFKRLLQDDAPIKRKRRKFPL